MAARRTILPALCLALAVAALFRPAAFVSGLAPASPLSSTRGMALRSLPAGAVAETSVATSLAVSTPGFWANIVTVLVPITFLIVLYLQSERTKAEEGLRGQSCVFVFLKTA